VVRAILAEQDINTANIGGIMISTLLEPEAPTALSALVSYGWKDLETHIMRQKRYFDRVRPHMLDSSIEPIIEVPGHAAYPSGHSAQIHYLALVVGLVYPDAAPDLLMQAHEVAINREIAGVHYPSDSMAGALLAEQFVAALEQDLVFQELLGAAQKEATQK
jgi:acid phosphatase (class A)